MTLYRDKDYDRHWRKMNKELHLFGINIWMAEVNWEEYAVDNIEAKLCARIILPKQI